MTLRAPTTVATSANALLTALKVASAPLVVLRLARVCPVLVPGVTVVARPAASNFDA